MSPADAPSSGTLTLTLSHQGRGDRAGAVGTGDGERATTRVAPTRIVSGRGWISALIRVTCYPAAPRDISFVTARL